MSILKNTKDETTNYWNLSKFVMGHSNIFIIHAVILSTSFYLLLNKMPTNFANVPVIKDLSFIVFYFLPFMPAATVALQNVINRKIFSIYGFSSILYQRYGTLLIVLTVLSWCAKYFFEGNVQIFYLLFYLNNFCLFYATRSIMDGDDKPKAFWLHLSFGDKWVVYLLLLNSFILFVQTLDFFAQGAMPLPLTILLFSLVFMISAYSIVKSLLVQG